MEIWQVKWCTSPLGKQWFMLCHHLTFTCRYHLSMYSLLLYIVEVWVYGRFFVVLDPSNFQFFSLSWFPLCLHVLYRTYDWLHPTWRRRYPRIPFHAAFSIQAFPADIKLLIQFLMVVLPYLDPSLPAGNLNLLCHMEEWSITYFYTFKLSLADQGTKCAY